MITVMGRSCKGVVFTDLYRTIVRTDSICLAFYTDMNGGMRMSMLEVPTTVRLSDFGVTVPRTDACWVIRLRVLVGDSWGCRQRRKGKAGDVNIGAGVSIIRNTHPSTNVAFVFIVLTPGGSTDHSSVVRS